MKTSARISIMAFFGLWGQVSVAASAEVEVVVKVPEGVKVPALAMVVLPGEENRVIPLFDGVANGRVEIPEGRLPLIAQLSPLFVNGNFSSEAKQDEVDRFRQQWTWPESIELHADRGSGVLRGEFLLEPAVTLRGTFVSNNPEMPMRRGTIWHGQQLGACGYGEPAAGEFKIWGLRQGKPVRVWVSTPVPEGLGRVLARYSPVDLTAAQLAESGEVHEIPIDVASEFTPVQLRTVIPRNDTFLNPKSSLAGLTLVRSDGMEVWSMLAGSEELSNALSIVRVNDQSIPALALKFDIKLPSGEYVVLPTFSLFGLHRRAIIDTVARRMHEDGTIPRFVVPRSLGEQKTVEVDISLEDSIRVLREVCGSEPVAASSDPASK